MRTSAPTASQRRTTMERAGRRLFRAIARDFAASGPDPSLTLDYPEPESPGPGPITRSSQLRQFSMRALVGKTNATPPRGHEVVTDRCRGLAPAVWTVQDHGTARDQATSTLITFVEPGR